MIAAIVSCLKTQDFYGSALYEFIVICFVLNLCQIFFFLSFDLYIHTVSLILLNKMGKYNLLNKKGTNSI